MTSSHSIAKIKLLAFLQNYKIIMIKEGKTFYKVTMSQTHFSM